MNAFEMVLLGMATVLLITYVIVEYGDRWNAR